MVIKFSDNSFDSIFIIQCLITYSIKGQLARRNGNIYSLGGPVSLQPSCLPIFIKAAAAPKPKHAMVPVM